MPQMPELTQRRLKWPRMALVVGAPGAAGLGIADALKLFTDRLHGVAPDAAAQFPEISEIAVLNQRALTAMAVDPWDIGEFPQTWFASPGAAELARDIGAMVAREVLANDVLLIDDAALCRLLPLWKRLCVERNLPLHFIIPVHHPMDAAIDLEQSHAVPRARGLLVWLRYFVELERGTHGFPRSFIAVRPDAEHKPAGDWFGVDSRHAAPLPGLVAEAYKWGLSAARSDELSGESIDVIHAALRWLNRAYIPEIATATADGAPDASSQDTVRRLQQENYRLIGSVSELSGMAAVIQDLELERHLLIRRVATEEGHVRTLLSSTSWRLTAPVRWSRRMIIRMLRPARFAHPLSVWRRRLLRTAGFFPSVGCNRALQSLGGWRSRFLEESVRDPLLAEAPTAWPDIDLSLVTHNSQRWLDDFFASLLRQDYPLERVHVRVVDNASTDGTFAALETLRQQHAGRFASFELLSRPNRGFGAGHNAAIAAGSSALVLVANIDITFEPDSLTRIVAIAQADDQRIACWELRQRPYEHPKIYDPVTGLTNWNAHACVLLRRAALAQVGGFDERIFMYGEDVDLSYRLREAGFALRYCPIAAVNHYTYEDLGAAKPLQFRGTTFANLYLRLRFGGWRDVAVIPYLAASVLLQQPAYPGARHDAWRAVLQALRHAPSLLLRRRRHEADFPFLGWDYDFTRHGAFVRSERSPVPAPLVSVITRTHGTRGLFLAQALFSVAHQVYPNVEHIVVEDGGDAMRAVIDRVVNLTGKPVRHIPLSKVGRSAAGNAGLEAATGEFVVFLDDDDLFFQDHLETLVNALLADPGAIAAYSLAWEVRTDTSDISQGSYIEERIELHPIFMQEFDFDVLYHHNYMPIQAVLFKRELFIERGGFDTDLEALEDWNLWQRYAFGHRFVYVPKVTSLFRTPADSETRTQRALVLNAAYEPVRQRTRSLLRSFAIDGPPPRGADLTLRIDLCPEG